MKPIENMIRDAEQAKPASPKVLLLGLSFLVASNLMFLNAFSSVFYLVGIVSMGLHGVVATLTIPYAILCGAPIGMANALLAILWGRAYQAASPKQACRTRSA